jgi:hypothetical protein
MADIVAKVASRRLVRNNRLHEARHVNQSCATTCFIESMLPVGTLQNRFATLGNEAAALPKSDTIGSPM